LHLGGKRVEFAERLPAVIDRLVGHRIIAAGAIGLGPSAVPAAGGDASRLEREAVRITGFS
jgi:hypothetical protein